jgi:hypothetical protein
VSSEPGAGQPSAKEYKPHNEEASGIAWALFETIAASHLNTFDPALSIRHKFDGKLKSQKKHTQDFTSLALFRDDVECLLRDLYGDVESEALNSILRAVFSTVQQFAKIMRPDLWKEDNDAKSLDYIFGIGVPDGHGTGSSDYHRGMAAKFDLIFRAYEVGRAPSAFSEYTVKFANWFREQWYCSPETRLRMIDPPPSETEALVALDEELRRNNT